MNKDIYLLKKASKMEKDAKILRRILMVRYALKKETIRDVGKRLDCSHPTVLYWKERYFLEGLEGLKTKPKSGKPRKISRLQESNLKRIFSKENHQKPWTTKRASNLITEKTRVNYSQRQIRRILNRWNFGLTSGRPIYWHRASEEEIKKFGKKNPVLQK
jgi:putative transposase